MPKYKVGDPVRIFAVDGAKWAGISPEGAKAEIVKVARLKAVAEYGEPQNRFAVEFYMETGKEADNYHHRFVLNEAESVEFVRFRAADSALHKLGIHMPTYGVKLNADKLERILAIVQES